MTPNTTTSLCPTSSTERLSLRLPSHCAWSEAPMHKSISMRARFMYVLDKASTNTSYPLEVLLDEWLIDCHCPRLQMWSCFLLGRYYKIVAKRRKKPFSLWTNCDEARWTCIRQNCHDNLVNLAINARLPYVRAAALYALGTFVSETLQSA